MAVVMASLLELLVPKYTHEGAIDLQAVGIGRSLR